MRWIGIFMEREIYLFVIKPKGVDDLSIPRCPTVPVRSYYLNKSRLGATIEVVAVRSGFFRFYESEWLTNGINESLSIRNKRFSTI
jgi:hypothetical protein